jgi:hypothetical protein
MRALVTITTCRLYESNGVNQAMRDTWLKGIAAVGLDYRFFVGNGNGVMPDDVISLDIDDSYEGLTHKTVASHRWAMANVYDYTFQCCADCYARPERLMASGFEGHDYLGFPIANTGGADIIGSFDLCSGGAGYWLSPRANTVLIYDRPIDDFAEDRWVGSVMKKAEISLTADGRYNYLATPSPRRDNNIITCHLSGTTGGYDKIRMYETHEVWLKSLEG